MKYSKKPTFHKHGQTDSPIYEFCVRIIALSKDCSEVIASGTGVVITQNLILTAKHVFEEFVNKWKPSNENGELAAKDFNIWVLFISINSTDTYNLYEVASVYINPYSDQVLFHLDGKDRMGNCKHWKQPKLCLTIPKVGERAVSFGFIKSKIVVSMNNESKADIGLTDEPAVSVGEIIEVYPEKRDLYLLPFPSIRINARLEGGMSGGPVFNEDGQLLGTVCSSFNQDPTEGYISYVALLWPLMATALINSDKSIYPFYDLAKNGTVGVDTLENINLLRTNNSYPFNISYNVQN